MQKSEEHVEEITIDGPIISSTQRESDEELKLMVLQRKEAEDDERLVIIHPKI